MNSRYLIFLLILTLGWFACKKDSDNNNSSSTSNNTNNSSVNYAGTYTGTQKEVYTDPASGTEVGRDTADRIFVIAGSGSAYTMSYTDDQNKTSSINLSVSNNTLNGTGSSDTNDYFEGETYSGSLSGDQLTLNYTGVWDDGAGTTYNYTGEFTGNRPPTNNGGGSGGGTGGSTYPYETQFDTGRIEVSYLGKTINLISPGGELYPDPSNKSIGVLYIGNGFDDPHHKVSVQVTINSSTEGSHTIDYYNWYVSGTTYNCDCESPAGSFNNGPGTINVTAASNSSLVGTFSIEDNSNCTLSATFNLWQK